MSDDAYDGPWEWSLGSFAQTEHGPQIHIGRVISEEEHAEWKEAASFISTLVSGSTYPQALAALRGLTELVKRLGATPETDRSAVDLDALSPAFLQVARLLDRAAERTLAELDDFPIPPEDADLVRATIAARAEDQVLQRCRAISEANQPPRVTLRESDDGAAKLALDEAGADALALLRRATFVIQLMHAERLAGLARHVREAATMLRHATAEVLEGPPTLIRHRPFAEDEPPNLRTISFEDLALHRVQPVLHLIEQSERLLQAQSTAGGEDAEPPLTAEGNAEAANTTTSDEEPAQDDAEDDEPLLDPGTVDVITLLGEMNSLGEELEGAWSQALDGVLRDVTLEPARARWGSLLQALGHEAETGSKRALALGLDPMLSGELLAAVPGAVELDPDPPQAFKQAEVAYIYAFEPLVAAIQGLLTHPIERVMFSHEHGMSSKQLWDSGAFAAVRERARFVAAVEEERAAARALAAGSPRENENDRRAAKAMQKLRTAESAFDRGDPEAAILHLSHFFDLADETLIDTGRLDAAARHIALLRAAAGRLKSGLPVTTATIVARSGFVAAATLLMPPEHLSDSQPPENDRSEG